MMERLTKRDEFGNADIIGVDSLELQLNLEFDELNKVTELLNKLADYEDIGLTPAQLLEVDKLYAEKCREVAGLKAELERYKPKPHVIDETCCKMRGCNKCDAYRKECERLKAELEQSVKLPCKVGDTVYELNKRGFISTYKITSIVLMTGSRNYNWELIDGIYSNLNGFNEGAIGKCVFLTLEEAEQALVDFSKKENTTVE